MNTPQHTLTIGIDYAETAKEITARLAITIAGRHDAKPPGDCRFKELAAMKIKDACTSLSTAISGYVTDFNASEELASIVLALPCSIGEPTQRLIALRAKEAIAQSAICDFLTSMPQFNAELELCTSMHRKALSSLRQLLAPH